MNMKKITAGLKVIVIGVLFLTFHLSLFTLTAQELTVQAPQSVYVGDNFTVRFVVNDKAKDFRGPDFKGFSLRSGPNSSSSTSMTRYLFII